MDESKRKKIIVATTVGAVLLLVILLCVMVYQMIAISVERKRSAELETAKAEYEQLIQNGKDTFDARSKEAWIVRRARELGYIYPDDIILD